MSETRPFGPDLLGAGDLKASAQELDAICAVFDLGGFTSFVTRQRDPHLTVPKYLGAFIDWLFFEIEHQSNKMSCPLPFFAKFLGDGGLFLWDAKEADEAARRRIIKVLFEVCSAYHYFLDRIRRDVGDAPEALRCGVARGKVFSLGEGKDFVGSCINLASRLQKLGRVFLAVSKPGLELGRREEGDRLDFVLKRVEVRGVGERELVYVPKRAFEALAQEERRTFLDP